MTLPEVLMWGLLRGRKPAFRRQHPQGPYILDFYCSAVRLCIEIDGQDHDVARDSRRDAWLLQQGIDTIRLPAVEGLRDPEEAAEHVLTAVRARLT